MEDIRPWGAAGALRAPPRRLGRRGVPGPLGRPWNRRPPAVEAGASWTAAAVRPYRPLVCPRSNGRGRPVGPRGGRRRARSALKCWDGRPQAARPSILFGGPGPKAPGRQTPPPPFTAPSCPRGWVRGHGLSTGGHDQPLNGAVFIFGHHLGVYQLALGVIIFLIGDRDTAPPAFPDL